MKSDRPIHPPSEDLFAYRDGELAPEKRALIEAHVMGCSTCRSFIDQVSSLEAELRQSPDRAPAEYLDHLHEAVRARIVAAGPVPAAEAEELAGEPVRHPAPGRDRRASIRGGRERRGNEDDAAGDRARMKDAPKLPWAAVLSTAGAAAAVLVVVVILMRQGFSPELPVTQRARERSAAQAPTVGSKSDRDLKATRDARKKSAEQNKQFLDKSKDQGAGAEEHQAGSLNRAAKKPEPGLAPLGKTADTHTRGGRSDEGITEITQKEEAGATGEKLPEKRAAGEPAPSPESTRELSNAAPQALSAPPAADQLQAPSPYDALMQRLGIPPVWDGAVVTPEALERAEPELRSLYVSGGAGADSARLRLYLAEAVRARYTPGDSVAYEEIEHHYKRAIALSKDAKTARVAAERLQTLQK